jgi:ketosteroid isomerase-like protein
MADPSAPSDNTVVVRRAYAAFSNGDAAVLEELIADDCVWLVGGDNALSGRYTGREAVLGYFSELQAATDGTFSLVLLTCAEVLPETVLACVHVTASAHGKNLEEDVVQQLHLLDGQVVACRTFVENGYAWDALVGPRTLVLPESRVRSR